MLSRQDSQTLALLISIVLIILVVLMKLTRRLIRWLIRPTMSRRRRPSHRPRPTYRQQLLEAAERYEAELQTEDQRLQALKQEPVHVVALHDTDEGTIGVGADGELVEIDPPPTETTDNLTDVLP